MDTATRHFERRSWPYLFQDTFDFCSRVRSDDRFRLSTRWTGTDTAAKGPSHHAVIFVQRSSSEQQQISPCRPVEAALAVGAQLVAGLPAPRARVRNLASRRRSCRVAVNDFSSRSPSTGQEGFFGTLTGTPSTGRAGTWSGRGRCGTSPTTRSGDCCCAAGSPCRRGAFDTLPIGPPICTGSCEITATRSFSLHCRRNRALQQAVVDLF
jgi:hypothetical protein